MRRGPMSSSAVADLSASRRTKEIKIKRLFDAKHREKPRRGDAAEMAVIELV